MEKLSPAFFGQKAIMPFLAFIFFGLLFMAFGFTLVPDTTSLTNQGMIDIFQKWSPYAGFVFGFLSMILMYIIRLFGLRRLRFCGGIIILAGFLPWLLFGYNLVYLEPRYASIAVAIILFLGKPMLYAGAVMVALGLLSFLLCLFGKPKIQTAKTLLLLVAPLFLSGCLGDVLYVLCGVVEDEDHCYQSAAVQKADPYGCEKIEGQGFKGSNPPRDKCYLMIAENTGDYSACDHIQGGPMSYTKEDCIFAAAIKHEDPAGCKMLTGLAFENCKHDISRSITTGKLADIAEQIEDAKSALGKDPDNPELQKKLAGLEAEKAGIYEFASPEVQTAYFREKREKMMEFLDEDVKSAIAKQFAEYRSDHPDEDLDSLIKKMETIKEDQEYVKRLDENVNEVFDEMKNSVTDFVSQTADDATGASEFVEEMQERGLKWFKENGGERVQAGIKNLEWAKEKYDKASEQYAQINEQIEKLKKAYDEAVEVYTKVDNVNKLLAEKKIDEGKASVLHGAIFLGKGLEYATEYVPVFGSTASTITKETFETVTKLATERAQRTTAIDKCIEDPENCDPSGISAY